MYIKNIFAGCTSAWACAPQRLAVALEAFHTGHGCGNGESQGSDLLIIYAEREIETCTYIYIYIYGYIVTSIHIPIYKHIAWIWP